MDFFRRPAKENPGGRQERNLPENLRIGAEYGILMEKTAEARAREEKRFGMVTYEVRINGIDVTARYSDRAVREIFLPLLRKLTALQKEKGKRLLLMLAAPPGAGKSTLLSFLEQLSRSDETLCPIQAIGMDGFHRRQEYLQSHETLRDGKRISLVEIKGAPITFDLERLSESIKKAASGAVCGWPVYDRLLHNPVENAVTVDSAIVALEGNYLLLDENGWRDLSGYADDTVSVRAEEEMLRDRLIERRMKTGVSRENSIRFVDFSDMPNVRLCLQKTMPADTQLSIGPDGDYHVSPE